MANKSSNTITLSLIVLFIFVLICSSVFGAVNIHLNEIYNALSTLFDTDAELNLNERIFLNIRLPRVFLCCFVGAALAVGGVLMQALFRNPIVEPGLIGTSSGAAFGAALYFALGASVNISSGEWTLPVFACAGGLLSTYLVFSLSNSSSARNSITALLLTGIAINALFMSGVGFFAYLARDPQARSITFWNLGTLSGANWHSLGIIAITSFCCILYASRYAKQLNALMLGEEEARHIGVNSKQLKKVILFINVIMIAIATAFVGVIAFIGLIVPHLLRMLYGSDNRYLIRYGVLLGAIVLSCSDLLARLIIQPAELPIGIVTSVIGVPVFIYLLRKKNYFF